MFEYEISQESREWLVGLYVEWRSRKSTNQRRYIIRQIKKKGYKITKDGEIEHRVVYEETHGKIKHGWVIHHINGKKADNHISNLIAMPRKAHNALHEHMSQNKCWYTRVPTEAFLAGFLAKEGVDD